MPVHTKYRVTLGFLSAFILLIVLGLFSYFSISQLIEVTEKRLRISTIQQTCEQILKDVIDIETGQRGYVLTFDQRYLQPYNQALSPLRAQVALLETQLQYSPSMVSKAKRLSMLIEDRIEHAQRIITARAEGFEGARQLIVEGKGMEITDSIRYTIEQIQQYTELEIGQLQNLSDTRLATMQYTFTALAFGMVIIIGALFYTINTQLKYRIQTEAKLREKIVEVQELYDHAPCGYLSVRQDIYLSAINQTLLNWLGYQREEVIGKLKFEDLLTHQSREIFLESFEKDFEKYKREGIVNGLEFNFLRKDGSEFPVVVNSMAVFDEQGQFLQSRTTVFDNTERVKNETKFRSVLESSPDAMLIVGQQGKIQLANHQAEKLFGYARADMIGQSIEVLVPEEFRNAHVKHRSSFFESPQRRPMGEGINLMALRANGGSFAAEISLSPLKLDDELLVIAAIRDVTANREAKEKITKLNKELESFTYSVSHDLRAPLRSIHGYAQILKEDFVAELSPEAIQTLDTIIRNASKMGTLIDDLLEFSRMSRREVFRDKVNVQELVDQVIEERVSKDTNIEFNCLKLEATLGDKNMLRQVWFNLIDNAIKYSGKHESPRVEIGCLSDSQWVTYYVRDNGAGFDMKYAAKLFGVFQRLHKMNEFEGTGVGLALVKRIIDRHNGQVWAEAEVNKGATFYFKLPQS